MNIVQVIVSRLLQAHVLLHLLNSSNVKQSSRILTHYSQSSLSSSVLNDSQSSLNNSLSNHILPTAINIEAQVAESCKAVSSFYEDFKRKAADEVFSWNYYCF